MCDTPSISGTCETSVRCPRARPMSLWVLLIGRYFMKCVLFRVCPLCGGTLACRLLGNPVCKGCKRIRRRVSSHILATSNMFWTFVRLNGSILRIPCIAQN